MSERDSMAFDVLIVGGGPAGLSAAIRLKQLANQMEKEISVCILEKGVEVGAHILSGAVLDPKALNELLPNWKELNAPIETEVSDDSFMMLCEKKGMKIPNFLLPPLMKNHGNYIVSMGQVCRWLGEQAEGLGVEIYPGFAASELLYNDDGSVKGVATGDMGVGKDGQKKDSYQPGIELHGKYTFFAEGARGSLSKQLIRKFGLDEGKEPPKFGIGLKEVWQVEPEKHVPGKVVHTMGWPLDSKTGGGSFCYHYGENLVAIGFVIHLNYTNPYLSPFDEFQRYKHHPEIKPLLEGGKRLSYGSRAITEGGLQSIPSLAFPGGALIGCSAGMVNVPRIKGNHNAMKSGMLAAEAVLEALMDERSGDVLTRYQDEFDKSWIVKELKKVKNVKPLWSKFGLYGGLAIGGLDMWMRSLSIGLPFTMRHGKPDYACTLPASQCAEIEYPKPDGVVSFDKLSSVFVSNTNHEEDQPSHLKLINPELPIRENLPKFAEPAQRYCPAGVYEVVEEAGEKRFQINAQNCVHCKTCDIKDPAQNIVWTVPEGGGGPLYEGM